MKLELNRGMWRFLPEVQNRVEQLEELGKGSLEQVVRQMDSLGRGPMERSAVLPGADIGVGLVPSEVAQMVIILANTYGAFKTLNTRPARTGKVKFPIATTIPYSAGDAPLLKADKTAGQLAPVSTILGSGVDTEARDLPILLDVSLPVIEDDRADWGGAAVEILAAAIAFRTDWAAFSADGSDDTTDGAMTGIFCDSNIASVEALANCTQVESLQETDLLRTFEAVDGKAVQRGCRWWMNPTIYRKLLYVKDGSGARLVKFEAGVPYLLGLPLTLVAAAPSSVTAGSKVIACGCGDAYLVALREEIRMAVSDSPRFDYNMREFRATSRVFCGMLDSSWFATLKLAAE